MKSLEPDVEEQALLAGISMFSPFLRNVRDHDDIHLLSKIQVSKNILKNFRNFFIPISVYVDQDAREETSKKSFPNDSFCEFHAWNQ